MAFLLRSSSAIVKKAWKSVQVLWSGFLRHFVQSRSKRPVASMFSYPQRTSCPSEIVSWPRSAKDWPSCSCSKSVSIAVGGFHGAFIRSSLAD